MILEDVDGNDGYKPLFDFTASTGFVNVVKVLIKLRRRLRRLLQVVRNAINGRLTAGSHESASGPYDTSSSLGQRGDDERAPPSNSARGLLLSVALSSGLDGPMSDPGSKIRAQVEGDAPVCGWLVDHLRSLPLHSLRSLSLSLQGTGTVSTSIRLPLSWVRPGVPSEQRRGECLLAAAENSGTVAHDSKPWVCVRTDIRGGGGGGACVPRVCLPCVGEGDFLV